VAAVCTAQTAALANVCTCKRYARALLRVWPASPSTSGVRPHRCGTRAREPTAPRSTMVCVWPDAHHSTQLPPNGPQRPAGAFTSILKPHNHPRGLLWGQAPCARAVLPSSPISNFHLQLQLSTQGASIRPRSAQPRHGVAIITAGRGSTATSTIWLRLQGQQQQSAPAESSGAAHARSRGALLCCPSTLAAWPHSSHIVPCGRCCLRVQDAR
jgi:hypothetical protein